MLKQATDFFVANRTDAISSHIAFARTQNAAMMAIVGMASVAPVPAAPDEEAAMFKMVWGQVLTVVSDQFNTTISDVLEATDGLREGPGNHIIQDDKDPLDAVKAVRELQGHGGNFVAWQNMRMQYFLHVLVAMSSLGYRSGQGMKQYVPEVCANILKQLAESCTGALSKSSHAQQLLPIVEVQRLSGQDFVIFMNVCLDVMCSLKALVDETKHPSLFAVEHAKRKAELDTADAKKLYTEVQNLLKGSSCPSLAIQEKSLVYLADRRQAIQDLMGKFERDHAQEMLAWRLAAKPECCDVVLLRLKEASVPQTPDVVDSTNVAAASGIQATQPGKAWGVLYRELQSEEMADVPDDVSKSKVIKKMVVAKVQSEISALAFQQQGIDDIVLHIAEDAKGDRLKAVHQKTGVTTTLVYWGRVVDRLVAANIPNRERVMALGTCRGLSLYLDGTGVSSWDQSDFCPAWFVRPVNEVSA